MHKLKSNVLAVISTMLNGSTGSGLKPRIGLALSGGVDSMVLLDLLIQSEILSQYDILKAIHFNHGLRGTTADDDESFLADYCLKKSVDFYSEKIDVHKLVAESGKTVEEAARDLRYQRLSVLRDKFALDFIFLAHHADDKAETVFFNIMRGCGLAGLSTLKSINGCYRRPLLGVSKAEIQNYANQLSLPVREDYTNQENEYSRNKIRNVLIPQIEQTLKRNVKPALIRLSAIADETADFVLQSCLEALNDRQNVLLSADRVILKRDFFNSLHSCLAKEMLHQLFLKLGTVYHPGYLTAELLLKKIQTGEVFREVWQNIQIFSWHNYIYISQIKSETCKIRVELEQPYVINGTQILLTKKSIAGCGHFFCSTGIKGDMQIVPLDGSVEFYPFGHRSSRKISKGLSDKKIPLFFRDKMFMLVDHEKVLFVPGLGIDNRIRLADQEDRQNAIYIQASDSFWEFTGTEM